MRRRTFEAHGMSFSYLDAEGDGPALIALHAHWMEACTFVPLAGALAPSWRLIALDQRGHGDSEHAKTYSREDYLSDLLALYDLLHLDNACLLGNSLGGVNAYQFAAKYPERVQAMIIEEIGATVDVDLSFILPWAGVFSSKAELYQRIGPRLLPYLQASIRQTPAGWRLPFDVQDMIQSQSAMNGDHWADWLKSTCPALLLRGTESRVTTQNELEQMAKRRPNTQLVALKGGHVLHMDNFDGFVGAVKSFLTALAAR